MKILKNILLILLIPVLSGIAGCDKIDNPVPEGPDVISDTGIIWDDSSSSIPNAGNRFVLFEEFTGHQCNNCPESTEFIEEIKKANSPGMISVSIHAGAFADIKTRGEKFLTDFKTDAGNKYRTNFDVESYPSAMINRIKVGTKWALIDDVWQEEAEKIVNGPAIADIMINNRYDDSTKLVQCQVIIDWKSDISEDYNLQLYLVEDSIQDWQLDRREDPEAVPDYYHRHVFRGDLNGIFGELLSGGLAASNDTIVNTFEVPEKIIDLKKCQIIAFIYEPGPENFEIMQVNEAHILSH